MEHEIEQIWKRIRASLFVAHIQRHLKEEEVICKICGKTVEECAREELNIILDKSEVKKVEDILKEDKAEALEEQPKDYKLRPVAETKTT